MGNVIPLFTKKEGNEDFEKILQLFEVVATKQGIDAPNREKFLQALQTQETKGEIQEHTYGIKTRIAELLGLNECSTWHHMISVLENTNPEHDWVQQKEA